MKFIIHENIFNVCFLRHLFDRTLFLLYSSILLNASDGFLQNEISHGPEIKKEWIEVKYKIIYVYNKLLLYNFPKNLLSITSKLMKNITYKFPIFPIK